MKTYSNYIYKSIKLISLFLVMLIAWSCGGGQQQERDKKLKEVKETTNTQLENLMADIDKRIQYLDEQIEEASGELEENLKEVREELKNQKKMIANEVESVKKATFEGWNEALSHATQKYQEARSKTNEVSKKVREWLEE